MIKKLLTLLTILAVLAPVATASEHKPLKPKLEEVLNCLFIIAGKFNFGTKGLAEKVFMLEMRDRELAAAQEMLSAALERAKEAGHYLASKYKVVCEKQGEEDG